MIFVVLLLLSALAFSEVDSLNMRMLDVYVSDLELEYAPKVIEYHDGFIYWSTGESVELLHITGEGTIEHEISLPYRHVSTIAFYDSVALLSVINRADADQSGYILLDIASTTVPESLGSFFSDTTFPYIEFGFKVNDTLFYGSNILWNVKNPLEPVVVASGFFEYIDYPYAYGLTGGYEDHEFYEEYWGILKVMNLEDTTPTWRELYVGPRGEDYNGFEDIVINGNIAYLAEKGNSCLTCLLLDSSCTSATFLCSDSTFGYSNDIEFNDSLLLSRISKGVAIFDIRNSYNIEITNYYHVEDTSLLYVKQVLCDSLVVSTIWWNDLSYVGGLALLHFENTHNINEQGSLEKPDKLHLDIFPNPFNSSIEIMCSKPADCNIKDLSGRIVEDLTDDELLSSANWRPADNTSSGVYIIEARDDNNECVSNKVVYIK